MVPGGEEDHHRLLPGATKERAGAGHGDVDLPVEGGEGLQTALISAGQFGLSPGLAQHSPRLAPLRPAVSVPAVAYVI